MDLLEADNDAHEAPWIYLEQDPFVMNSLTNLSDAEIADLNELRYFMRGRNAVVPGTPYLMHKITAATRPMAPANDNDTAEPALPSSHAHEPSSLTTSE